MRKSDEESAQSHPQKRHSQPQHGLLRKYATWPQRKAGMARTASTFSGVFTLFKRRVSKSI